MHIHACVPTVAVLVSSLVASAAAQSLGDLARREEERRKTVKADVKAITNRDVPRVPPPTGAAAAPVEPVDAEKKDGSDDKTAAPADAKAAPAAEPVKDQKYWAERAQGLQAQLARDRVYAGGLQSRVNALTADFVNRDDPAQRAAIAAERQKILDELTRLNTAITTDTQAIADFEEEARKANVPPGWLR